MKRLQVIQQNMAQTSDRSAYGTDVGAADFGANFSHAAKVHEAHQNMQGWLTATITDLSALIDDFGNKAQTVNNAYKGLEADGVANMTYGQGTV
ncbi:MULTISPECIES: hypothetical protein [Kitasatospora]|uniref:hypothetical protein n=1 Tax=Kitasatospora TaxID=2063 RepID=UPI0002F15854|nr:MULTISPECIES: hypothetical protein [Kitasatospora]